MEISKKTKDQAKEFGLNAVYFVAYLVSGYIISQLFAMGR